MNAFIADGGFLCISFHLLLAQVCSDHCLVMSKMNKEPNMNLSMYYFLP